MSELTKSPRSSLIKALADCVSSLSQMALIDASYSINQAMRQDERIWDYLDDETVNRLGYGLGIYPDEKAE
jgi:hypothetical protein